MYAFQHNILYVEYLLLYKIIIENTEHSTDMDAIE